jgi:Fe-S cluster assembly iron-binding protein IscA
VSTVATATHNNVLLTLALAGGPIDGDAVVEDHGARVFLDPAADQLLADQQLDAGTDPEGQVQFTLVRQA